MAGIPRGVEVKIKQWDGEYRWDRILEFHPIVKNNRPGYSLASGHWCYAKQIIETKQDK